MLSRFLAHWFTMTLALAVVVWIVPGVAVTSFPTLLIGAFVLGFVNATVRPILFLLTLPITVLTLGLFYFVVNGLAFALAAALVPGFEVKSFGWAMLAAVVAGLVSWFVGLFTGRSS